MPDTSEPRATLPFPSGTDAAAEAAQDPLAGDWAEGLRGPVREVPLKRPTRLRGQSIPTPRPLAALPPEQRTEQADLRILGVISEALGSEPPGQPEVEAPDAWASTDDQLASVPPPAREQAEAAAPAADAPLAAAPAAVNPQGAEPALEARAPGHDSAGTLHPAAFMESAVEPFAAAAAEPAGEEVMLLSDAELAEDEPPAANAPVSAVEAAPVEPAAQAAGAPPPAGATEAVAAPREDPAPAAQVGAESAPAAETAPAAPAEPEPPAVAVPVEPLALPAAPEEKELALPPVAEPLALPLGPSPAGLQAGPETGSASELVVAAADALAAASQGIPTDHLGAPIPPPAEAATAPSQLALPDDDLESTVLSPALAAIQRPAEPAAGAAPLASSEPPAPAQAAPAEDAVEQLPEDAIAEELPEDAIAGTADPAAPWSHVELEVTPHGAAPAAPTPWDTAAAPRWHEEASSGEWAGSAPQPATPWAASAAAASEGWPGAAAAQPAPSEPWGAPGAPAAPTGDWGDAPPAAPAAHGAWDAPAAPANTNTEPWGAPALAAAPVVPAWAGEPAGSFSANKLVSTPGAEEWVIEAVPPPAAGAWETAKPSAHWEVPVAAAAGAGGWEAKTQTAFPVAAPDTQAGSPFAPLAPGASLSADDPVVTDHVDHSLDDADLPVPIYEPEPVLPTSQLAVSGEHRVAIHTRAGRTRRGVVKDIDLTGRGFSLEPQSGTGAPESVQASEVKAIFFMLRAGEKPAPGTGAKVRVTFEDGRTIEGQREGADAPEGFFLVPSDAARTNTRRIFVARAAVQDLREG